MNSQTSTSKNSDSTPSPLGQVNPRSLDELFAAEPDTLSDADIAAMIQELRANRANFKQAKQARTKVGSIPTGSVDEMMELLDLKKAAK